jgi:PadR family transcriptional regulator, regulatory protein AphA
MARTATTRNAILGLLALRPEWPIYALTQQLRRNMRFFWPRAESRIYDEARALVANGFATARTVRSGVRTRTAYTITPAGRRELAAWLETEPSPTALACEALLRILLSDLSDPEQIQAALARIRKDAQEILDQGRIVAREYLEGRAPFQDQVHVRALVFDFLSSHALMLLEWADRTERTTRRWGDVSGEERDQASVAAIARSFARFPTPRSATARSRGRRGAAPRR